MIRLKIYTLLKNLTYFTSSYELCSEYLFVKEKSKMAILVYGLDGCNKKSSGDYVSVARILQGATQTLILPY